MKHYPLGDMPSRKELEDLGVQGGGSGNGYRIRKAGEWVELRGVSTDEFRSPKAGERYLDGVVCYRARRRLSGCYWIVHLIVMRQVTTWEIVE